MKCFFPPSCNTSLFRSFRRLLSPLNAVSFICHWKWQDWDTWLNSQLLLLNISFLFDSLVFHIKEINCKVLTYHGLLKTKFMKGLSVCMLSCFTHIRLFVNQWTVAHQAPLSMGLSRQGYWSESPCPPPGESSWPRDRNCVSSNSCMAGWFFTIEPPGKSTKGLVLNSCSVVTDSLWPHGLQQDRLPCPSPTPGACSSSCPSSRWSRQTILSSVVSLSSCLQSFPASESFPMSQFFTSGGQSSGVSASASVLPMNIQDWFPLGLTGLISLQSKGLSRVFSNTTVQKHQFFSAQLSLALTSIHDCWKIHSFD